MAGNDEILAGNDEILAGTYIKLAGTGFFWREHGNLLKWGQVRIGEEISTNPVHGCHGQGYGMEELIS